jgi:cytidylate kinase
MAERIVVAIDGPAGAGKSTVAREVARRLGYILVDTGALYRGLALAAKERGIPWTDGPRLGVLAAALRLGFITAVDGSQRLLVDGVDRADEIRTPEISMGASDVSKHTEVRAALLGIQRGVGRDGGVVLEGRDIGTVVFPHAEAKVFLTASPEMRAQRRVEELRARGASADFAATLSEVKARDAQDQGRAVSPLKPAPDSTVIDSTDLSIEEVVARVLAVVSSATSG